MGAAFVDPLGCLTDIGKLSCFGVVTRSRTYYMCGEDEFDCLEWLRILKIVCRQKLNAAMDITPDVPEDTTTLSTAQTPQTPVVTTNATGPVPRRGTITQRVPSMLVEGQAPGGERHLTDIFRRMREVGTRDQDRQVERLKNRVAGLLQGPVTPMSREKFEQSVVPWQKEASATHCPYCSKEFSLLGNRKAHCRLCGRLACQKPGCTDPVSLTVIAQHVALPIKSTAVGEHDVIRVCTNCHAILNQAGNTRNM